jgi:hypothetical protein
MNERIPDHVFESIIADMEEGERLKTLSSRELVQEFFMAGDDDDLITDEMAHRLDPNCMKEVKGH